MNVHTETSETDPGLRRADVRRARELYEAVVRQKRGEVVFLAGQPGSGRTVTLHAVADALGHEQSRPAVIGGHFAAGRYVPWERGRAPVRKGVAATGAGIPLLAAGADPATALFVAFAGQLVQTIAAVWDLLGSRGKHPESPLDSPADLKRLLRHAAEERPVVCLIDDLDAAEGSAWSDLVLTFAREVARDLPLLLIVSVEGPEELGEHQPDESNVLYVARSLKDEGLAEWWPLRPLDRDGIAAWLGAAEPEIVRRLHAVTGGNPRWLKLLWEHWQEHGVVAPTGPDNRWRLVPDHAEQALPPVNDVLADRLRSLLGSEDSRVLDESLKLLACAALEGRRFTADAVARVLGRDRDELVDFLDDTLVQTEDRPEGMLVEEESVPIDDPRTDRRYLCRYAFTSDLYWLTLERYGLPDPKKKAEASLSLARALTELYAPDEQRVARTLAHLYEAGGDHESAVRYRRMADYSGGHEVLRWQALAIPGAPKEGWSLWDYQRNTTLHLKAGWKMVDAYPFSETLAVFETAYDMACRTGVREDQAGALRGCGWLHENLGEYDTAARLLQQALALFQQLGDRAGEAASWHHLATIDRHRRDYAEARAKSRRSLAISQEIGNQGVEAGAWHHMATIDLDQGDYTGARAKFERSLRIRQEFGDRAGEARTCAQLGILAARIGRQGGGLRLVTLGAMLFQGIGHRDLEWAEGWVKDLAYGLAYSQEQFDALWREVAEAYQQDRGGGLIEAAFREG